MRASNGRTSNSQSAGAGRWPTRTRSSGWWASPAFRGAFTEDPALVEIRTRRYGAYEVNTTYAPVEEDVSPTVYAAKAAFEKAGVGPEDVDVIQLQDTNAGAELIHMAEAGFCADGEQEKLLTDGATEITGAMPVNTDGGLIANGEPIGASGRRQIHELVCQLRGEAGERQVPARHESDSHRFTVRPVLPPLRF